MPLIGYVLVTAALVVMWGFLSSWFPRLGVVANLGALGYLIQSVLRWKPPGGDCADVGLALSFGWAVLLFITVLFGLFAAFGGLIEQHQRTTESSALPRARIRIRN